MAIAWYPRRWLAKPALSAHINWGHPLTYQLSVALLMNESGGVQLYDQAVNLPLTTSAGTLGWLEGAVFDGSTYVQRALVIPAIPTGCSVTYKVKFTSASRLGIMSNYDGSAGIICGIAATTSAGQPDFFEQGWYGSNGGTSVAINDGYWHTVTFTYDAHSTAVVLYVDGALIGSAFTVAGGGTNGPLLIGREETFNFTGQMAFLYYHDRPLNQAEAIKLYLEPYCFMQPQSPRPSNWFAASSAASPDTTIDMPPVIVYYPDTMMYT